MTIPIKIFIICDKNKAITETYLNGFNLTNWPLRFVLKQDVRGHNIASRLPLYFRSSHWKACGDKEDCQEGFHFIMLFYLCGKVSKFGL